MLALDESTIFQDPGGVRGIAFRSQSALGSVPAALGREVSAKRAPKSLPNSTLEALELEKKTFGAPRVDPRQFPSEILAKGKDLGVDPSSSSSGS